MRAINAELSRTSDRQRLLQFARRSLYVHKQVIPRERELRAYIAKAIRQHEATLVREIIEAIDPELLAQWKITIPQQRENGAEPLEPSNHRVIVSIGNEPTFQFGPLGKFYLSDLNNVLHENEMHTRVSYRDGA